MRIQEAWPREIHGVVVLLCVLAVLAYVPIPLGSNRPHAWYGFEMFVYGVVVFWALGAFLDDRWRRVLRPTAGTLAVLLCWLSLIFLQTVALPEAVVEELNPLVHALQTDLGLISVEAPDTLSIDPGNTYNEFLKYGAYIGVFFLLVVTVTTRTRLMLLVGFIVAAGTLEAMFGIYTYASGFVLFPETDTGRELRTGTFVNRNHYANLLTMSLGLVFGLLTAALNSQVSRGRLDFKHFNDSNLAALFSLIAVALIILAGILISGSRAPVVFFTLSFGVMLLLSGTVQRPRTGEFVLAPVILLGALLVVMFMGFDKSVFRLLERDLLGGERMLQNFAGLGLLSSVWLTGVGAGNYRWVFPMFRGDDLRFATYDHAHNDYLQTAIEQGLPVAGLLGVAIWLLLRELYRGYKNRRNPLIRGVIFGCMMSLIFMLLHSSVEFNFRIPANAAYFFAIAAAGTAACRIDRGKTRSRSTEQKRGSSR